MAHMHKASIKTALSQNSFLKSCILGLSLAVSCSAFAANVKVGQSLPSVTVSKAGEMMVQNDAITYQTWASESMQGKVRVIQAIAGRSGAKAMNEPLTTAITAAKFDPANYQTTTIVNQSDSIWGTGSFVKSSAESSKKEFSWSSVVLDENGVAAKVWALAPENSAIIVQDKAGKVLYFKEGKLSDSEIEQVLNLVKAQL